MKNDDLRSIERVLRVLLAGPLADPAAVHLAEPGATVGKAVGRFVFPL